MIVTSNSLASLCENAQLAIKVPWLFSNVWHPSLSNQHLLIHHEIITTELEFDSVERLAGSSAGQLLPRHPTDSRKSINATSSTLSLDRKPSRILSISTRGLGSRKLVALRREHPSHIQSPSPRGLVQSIFSPPARQIKAARVSPGCHAAPPS